MATQEVDADFVAARIGELPIIDVRSTDEFVEGHIPSAWNVSLGRVGPTQAFVEQVEGIIPAKDQPIIVYCKSGARAGRAAEVLTKAGYEHIFDYCGSWLDWIRDPSRPIAE